MSLFQYIRCAGRAPALLAAAMLAVAVVTLVPLVGHAATISFVDTTQTSWGTPPLDFFGIVDDESFLSNGAAPPLSLALFDPALGILTAVEISFVHTGTATGSPRPAFVGVNANLSTPISFDVQGMGNGAPSAGAAVDVDPEFVGPIPAGNVPLENTVSNDLFYSSAPELGFFQGVGSFTIDPIYMLSVLPPETCGRGACPYGQPAVGENDLQDAAVTTEATVTYTFTVVPEPSTGLLVALGLAGGAWTVRRQGRAS